MEDGYHSIPECGWACRLSLDDPTLQTIDLSDGSSISLSPEKDAYLWYDIDGNLVEQFLKGTEDFDAWAEVHEKLLALQSV